MKIKIITDSTCDLDNSFLNDENITMVPLKTIFSDGEYRDRVDLTPNDFFEKLINSSEFPTTSQVNPGEFLEVFDNELKTYDHIIGLFISSELSGTYNSALIAKDMLEKGSDRVHIIDSRLASFGLGFLIIKLIDFLKEENDVIKAVEYVNDIKTRIPVFGRIDTLEFLKRGGRLSSTTAAIGTMLSLKPIVELKDGKLDMKAKVRGSNKSIQWLIDQLTAEFPNKEIDELMLGYCYNREEVEQFKEIVLTEFKVNKIYNISIGSVIGSHLGPNAVGISYLK